MSNDYSEGFREALRRAAEVCAPHKNHGDMGAECTHPECSMRRALVRNISQIPLPESAEPYRVDLYYKGGIDSEKDTALRGLVESLGGREVGSGCVLGECGERDIGYSLPDIGAANDFVKAAHAKFPGDLRHRIGWRSQTLRGGVGGPQQGTNRPSPSPPTDPLAEMRKALERLATAASIYEKYADDEYSDVADLRDSKNALDFAIKDAREALGRGRG